MSELYLKTKFSPPRLVRYPVRREHILHTLAARKSRVTILHAPGGYGKTTLASQYRGDLIVEGYKVAWFNIDANDNTPRNFLNGLVNALSECGCTIAQDSMNYFKSNDKQSMRHVLTTLTNDLMGINFDYYIFFDQFQKLNDPHIQEELSKFILNCPANLYFVFITRNYPDLNLTKLKIENEINEIGVSDLKFRYEEAREFLQNRVQTKIDADQQQMLFDETQGWPIAMEWAVMAASKGALGDVKTFFSDHDGGFIAVFPREIMDGLPEATKTFLFQTSILDSFNLSLARAVTRRDDCAQVVEYLEEENYFLLPLEGEPNWYQYHPLFLSTLRHQLLDAYAEETRRRSLSVQGNKKLHGTSPMSYSQVLSNIKPVLFDVFELNRRAGEWCQQNGLSEQALHHYLLINDYESILKLLEDSAQSLLESGRLETLLGWAQRLPSASIAFRPRLILQLSWATMLSCQTVEADTYLKMLENLYENQNEVTLGEVKAARGAYYVFIDDSQKAQDVLSDWDRKGNAFDIAAGCNALALMRVFEGKFEEAREIVKWVEQRAELQTKYFPYIYRQAVIALSYALEGSFEQSNRISRAALDLAEQRQGRRSAPACVSIAVLSDGYYEQNRLAELQDLLANRFDVISETVYPESLIRAYISGAKTYWALGDTQKSNDLLDQLFCYGEGYGYNRVMVASLSEKLRQAVAKHQVNRTRTLLDRLKTYLPSDAPSLSFDTSGELVLLVKISVIRTSILFGQFDVAREEVAALLNFYVKSCRRRLIAKLFLMQAFIELKIRKPADALDSLKRAIKLGMKCELKRLFIDERIWCEALLLKFSPSDQLSKKMQKYIIDLLACNPVGENSEENISQSAFAKTPRKYFRIEKIQLSPKEKEVLGYLVKGLPNKRIALAMNVSPETVRWHLKNIFSKLDVSTRYDAGNRAKILNLI